MQISVACNKFNALWSDNLGEKFVLFVQFFHDHGWLLFSILVSFTVSVFPSKSESARSEKVPTICFARKLVSSQCYAKKEDATFSTSSLSTESSGDSSSSSRHTGSFRQQGEVLQLYRRVLFKGFPLLSSRNRKRVTCVVTDLHNPAPTQMIDGTEKPKNPFEVFKTRSAIHWIWQ